MSYGIFWNNIHVWTTELIAAPRRRNNRRPGELKENPWNLFQSSWRVRFTIHWRRKKKADMKALDPHVLHCRSNGKGPHRMGNWRHHSDCDHCRVRRPCYMSTFRLLVQLSGSNKSENQKHPPPPAEEPAESFQVCGSFSKEMHGGISVNDIQNKKTFQISMWLFYSWQRALKGLLMINNKGDM